MLNDLFLSCKEIKRNYNQLAQAGDFLSNFAKGNNPPKQTIVTVNGYLEAKDFRLDKNESIAMLDSNADILYLKECDDIGKYTLKVFRCEEITQEFVQQSQPQQISKAEFDKLSKDIADLKSMLMSSTNKGAENGKYNAKQ